MTSHNLEDFVQLFLAIDDTRELPANCRLDIRSLSLNEAYAIQQRIIEHRVSHGARVVGYKVGCTSRAIREQFGLTEPVCGTLLSPLVYEGDTTLNWNDYVQCAVEPEYVFRIARDVRWDVSDERELLDAIEWVAPGIELHQFKFWFGQPTSQELIISNGIHAGLVVGRQRQSPASLDLDQGEVQILRNQQLAASGPGFEIMGGPLKSLRWLVLHLLQRGDYLRAGQWIIPGSPVKLVSVAAGDNITAAISGVGQVTATFADR